MITDGGYRKRLAGDLPRWREAGWVTVEGTAAILAEVEGRRSSFGLAAIMGVLGALLIGAGVVAFVGANWELMPRIFRFGLLVAAMAVAYGAAAMLAAREFRIFSEAALLVAGLVFAAAIALVGQTYHLSGEFSDAVLLWEVGVVGAALFTGSATLTVLAFAGAGYWAWLNVVELGYVPHWLSLIFILIGCAMTVLTGARYTRLVAVLALAFWIALNLIGYAIRVDWSPFETFAAATAIALLFWAVGSVGATDSSRKALAAFGHAMLWPGIAAVLLAVGVLQTAPDWHTGTGDEQWIILGGVALIAVTALVVLAWQRKGITAIDAIGALAIGLAAMAFAYAPPESDTLARLLGGIIVLGAAVWAINLGQSGPQRVGKKTGLVAFGIEVIYLYVVTLGTLMDTAAAFLGGGILFIALAYVLFRIDRRLSRKPLVPVEVAP
jgi:uncharacterized membrane protein